MFSGSVRSHEAGTPLRHFGACARRGIRPDGTGPGLGVSRLRGAESRARSFWDGRRVCVLRADRQPQLADGASAMRRGASRRMPWAHHADRRDAAPVTRMIATLGLFLFLTEAIVLIYQDHAFSTPSVLPVSRVSLGLGYTVGIDELSIVGLAVAVTAALAGMSRWSRF